MDTLVCFITAIFDTNITSCMPYVNQSVPTDFICFSNEHNILNNGWQINTTPYHGHIEDNRKISKYYKMMFYDIPILRKYAVIIWIDNNIEIMNRKISEYTLKKLYKHEIICWHHGKHFGMLKNEVVASNKLQKYSYNIRQQFEDYVKNGYKDGFFKMLGHKSPHFGVWDTSFMAFKNHHKKLGTFLQAWYDEIMKYGTNDIISFSYLCYKQSFIPYTLPNKDVYGEPYMPNQFYVPWLQYMERCT